MGDGFHLYILLESYCVISPVKPFTYCIEGAFKCQGMSLASAMDATVLAFTEVECVADLVDAQFMKAALWTVFSQEIRCLFLFKPCVHDDGIDF